MPLDKLPKDGDVIKFTGMGLKDSLWRVKGALRPSDSGQIVDAILLRNGIGFEEGKRNVVGEVYDIWLTDRAGNMRETWSDIDFEDWVWLERKEAGIDTN